LIMKNDAMLDKYIGDAVMAIFGAPVQRPDHARVACLTALEVQRVLDEYYARVEASGVPRFVTRIGLNSGRMIVGNIGHTKRLDYTAIGDTVNLASRLEGVNKVFGTRIIISESTYRLSGGAVEVRELDLIRVKGKEQAIRIYELVAGRGDLTPQTREKLALFHEGIGLYRTKAFEKAAEQFRKVLAAAPDDGPAQTYVERCTELAHATLPEEWDGVYTMLSK
jgi:adenylate cyclase